MSAATSVERAHELESRIDDLPVLPAVVSDLLTLDHSAEDFFEQLLAIAERDPPLAARVLRVANSPASAPVRPIAALHEALMRMGAGPCAELLLALSVMKVFIPHTPTQRALWLHSLQTALAARTFAHLLPGVHADPSVAHVCGLLHDIGRFVQLEAAPEDLSTVDAHAWTTPIALVDIECEELGYDHALLGHLVCRRWRLPMLIGEVVRRHHEPQFVRGDEPGALDELLVLVQWSDCLSVALLREPSLAEADAQTLSDALLPQLPDGSGWTLARDVRAWQPVVAGIHAESMRLGDLLRLT